MNEIYIDTDKMKENGQDIIDQVEELKITIDAMFDRIKNIPTVTLEWTGDSVNNFVTLAENDKVQYINYANDLYKYGKYLKDCANYMDKQINTVRRDV